MLENIFEEIHYDISWRNGELRNLKSISLRLSETDLKVFLKSVIPIIYAHWEGFVVTSLKIVFQYLNNLYLTSNDYCNIYLTTAYEQTLKSLDDSTGFDKRKKHLINLYKNFSEKVNLGTKIDTKSNLNYAVLDEICKKTNLNISKFEEYKDELNELVHIRNSIAHGENSYTFESYEDINKYIELLENLMLDFQSEIQDLLKNEKYKKELNDESI
jgi:hypothetical protein